MYYFFPMQPLAQLSDHTWLIVIGQSSYTPTILYTILNGQSSYTPTILYTILNGQSIIHRQYCIQYWMVRVVIHWQYCIQYRMVRVVIHRQYCIQYWIYCWQWASDCCSTLGDKVFQLHISMQEQKVAFWWDDDDVHFVQDQYA